MFFDANPDRTSLYVETAIWFVPIPALMIAGAISESDRWIPFLLLLIVSLYSSFRNGHAYSTLSDARAAGLSGISAWIAIAISSITVLMMSVNCLSLNVDLGVLLDIRFLTFSLAISVVQELIFRDLMFRRCIAAKLSAAEFICVSAASFSTIHVFMPASMPHLPIGSLLLGVALSWVWLKHPNALLASACHFVINASAIACGFVEVDGLLGISY